METVVWVRGDCMNGWKDFKTEGKTSVMSTVVGDQLVWQLRQWNSRLSSESMSTGVHAVLSMMTLGIGNCVADSSQGSCLMITSVHGRRFVWRIWTIMLVKEMLFSIELWQETSPGCTITNQRVRDDRCSGSTRCLWQTKNSRHRLPLGKSCWPSFGMSMALYWYTSRKRVKLSLVLNIVTC
jgi:hypothetical protein